MNVTIATTPGDLSALAARWDEYATGSPHASHALFGLVHEASGDRSRPHVLLIEERGRKPILVVARLEHRPIGVKAGYRTLFTAQARWLVVVDGGILGAESTDDHRVVLKVLTAALHRGGADILQLSKVTVGSQLHRAAARHLAWYRRGHGSTPQKHHTTDLGTGFDSLLARRSKGTRWRIRKRLRRLHDPEAKVAVRQLGSDDDVPEVVRTLDAITANSYQRGIGVGFVDDELHRALIGWAIDGGPYRVWVLTVDGTPVAYLDGLVHRGTFHLFETAFDSAHSDDEPGGILLAAVLEELAGDPDVHAFDYGYGDAQYKLSLSDTSWDEIDMLFFAARPRALSLNLLNTGAAGAVAVVKRILGGERVAALRRRERAQLSTSAMDRS
jgi:CelD/BcsL family acetyltransferase involved in cellulose biosynthesis